MPVPKYLANRTSAMDIAPMMIVRSLDMTAPCVSVVLGLHLLTISSSITAAIELINVLIVLQE